MNWIQRADSWFMEPCPAQRLAALRIAIGGFGTTYLLVRLPHWFQPLGFKRSQFEPLGVLSATTTPWSMAVLVGLFIISVVSGGLFTLGYRTRVFGPLYALGLLLLTTYRNSWGMIFHVENLLVLHTLALCLAPVAEAWAMGKSSSAKQPHFVSGWSARLLCLLTVLTYVIAGVAKLKAIGLEWAGGDVLREHIAYDAVRKLELGGTPSPLAPLIIGVRAIFPPLAALTLLVELAAPLALWGPRSALIWCLSAFSFHLGVLALMGIVFPYPLLFLAYLPFFPVEQWVRR